MKIPDAQAAVDKEWKKLETIPAWDGFQKRHRKTTIKVHFASLRDFVSSQGIRSWNHNSRSTKERVVLRGDLVKDDSGAYAVFAEQGSSASQMTAAKVMDVVARLLDCDGQAAYAISAYTQVKKRRMLKKLLNIPKSECRDIWIRLPKHKWTKSWEYIEDPVVPLERNLYGHPLAGLFG